MKILLNTLPKNVYQNYLYYSRTNRLPIYKDENKKNYVLSEDVENIAKLKTGSYTKIIRIKYNSEEYKSLGLKRFIDIDYKTENYIRQTTWRIPTLKEKIPFYLDEDGHISVQLENAMKEIADYKVKKHEMAMRKRYEYTKNYKIAKRNEQKLKNIGNCIDNCQAL